MKSDDDEGLRRVVGVAGLSLNVVNITIGAGIFALPAIVGIQLGAFSVFAYLFCGVMMATIMLCYAEIGTIVTKSGGSYSYVTAAFGDFPGFIVSWLAIFGWSSLGSAALFNIIADSFSVLFPVFSIPWIRGLLFFLLLAFISIANIRGAKVGMSFIKWITILKVLPLLGIIIFGAFFVDPANLHWESLPSLRTFGNTTLILFFAFAGFEIALGVGGEIKDPKRTIPRGVLLGGAIILILYLLLQTITQGVLGAQIGLFKDAPLAAVAERIVGSIGGTVLVIAAAISCFGAISSDVFNTPRVLYAGAGNGIFPQFLGRIHTRYITPHWSIICYAGLIFFLSVSGGFEQLAKMASTTILLIYLSVILAMIRLRMMKGMAIERTFKVPGGLIIPIFGIAGILWLLSNLSVREIVSTILFLVFIGAMYLVMKWFKRRS